jgi:hypothetical protein
MKKYKIGGLVMQLNNISKPGLIGLIIATLANIVSHFSIDPALTPFWKGLLWLITIISIIIIAIMIIIKKDDKK